MAIRIGRYKGLLLHGTQILQGIRFQLVAAMHVTSVLYKSLRTADFSSNIMVQ